MAKEYVMGRASLKSDDWRRGGTSTYGPTLRRDTGEAGITAFIRSVAAATFARHVFIVQRTVAATSVGCSAVPIALQTLATDLPVLIILLRLQPYRIHKGRSSPYAAAQSFV